MKTDRITVSDDLVSGLRAVIRDTGGSVFTYSTPSENRADISRSAKCQGPRSRKLANWRTVLALVQQGIDPQSGLHERLLRELA
jgi:hypothetical protein